MNDYYEVNVEVSPCNEDITDYIAAVLGDIGFESFVPSMTGVKAYVKAELYDPAAIDEALADLPFDCSVDTAAVYVPGQDWNAEWEKNYFKPIVVDGRCVIHSSFHTDIPTVQYDIVIDPKMAFGTGHHSTTSLIIAQLLDADLTGKTVIDMGTGTGILAILAAMKGASNVYGIEIDGFAYDNAIDNVRLNGHSEITVIHGDASALAECPPADLFIANINRNIITTDLPAYASRLNDGATMLLSGFYEQDIPIVLKAAAPLGLIETYHTTKPDGWACLRLQYEQ